MAIDLFVGTVGTSVWFSKDEGETWARPYTESGLYLEARVWSLASSADAPERIFAGTDSGLQRWNPADACWKHFSSDLDAHAVWSLEVSPHDPRRMLALADADEIARHVHDHAGPHTCRRQLNEDGDARRVALIAPRAMSTVHQ